MFARLLRSLPFGEAACEDAVLHFVLRLEQWRGALSALSFRLGRVASFYLGIAPLFSQRRIGVHILIAMEPRQSTYVWATWAAKVMSGEVNCLFAYWLRANYRYNKLPSSFDLARWTADHTALVQKQAQALREQGWRVKLEGENNFNLQGRSGTIGGKPDIVGVRGEEVRVWDAKTGKPRHSDAMQVWIYLACLPHLAEWKFDKLPKPKVGTVLYGDGTTTEVIYQGKEDPLMPKFQSTMAMLARDCSPEKSPSYEECRFCDISKEDCPERVEEPPKTATTDLF